MPNYIAMYRKLFAAQTDAIEGMQEIIENLVSIHKQMEELYINEEEAEIVLLSHSNSGDEG